MYRSVYQSFKDTIFPAKPGEGRSFLLAFVVLFLLYTVEGLLRNLQDVLLITGTPHGAEALTFIEFWVVLPTVILATVLYARAMRAVRSRNLFPIIIGLFLAFFVVYASVIYPAREQLYLESAAQKLDILLPTGLRGLITVVHFWPVTLFYAMASLWKPLVIAVMFWGFLNRSSSIEQASRLYPPLMLSASLANITAGQTAIFLSGTTLSWAGAIPWVFFIMIMAALIALGLFRHLEKRPLGLRPETQSKASQPSPTLFQSFRLLSASPYLLGIALIVYTDNIAYVLMQPLWKYHLGQLYPNPHDYFAYMGTVATLSGLLTACAALFISGPIIRRCGWTFAASVTPTVLLVTSAGFFFFILFSQELTVQTLALSVAGASPLMLGVFFGSVRECLCRASKYTLLDTTKEMAYIPLERDTQQYAKTAIDGVGSRLGKSTGYLLQQGLLIGFASLSQSALPVALIILGATCIWLFAVRMTGTGFELSQVRD